MPMRPRNAPMTNDPNGWMFFFRPMSSVMIPQMSHRTMRPLIGPMPAWTLTPPENIESCSSSSVAWVPGGTSKAIFTWIAVARIDVTHDAEAGVHPHVGHVVGGILATVGVGQLLILAEIVRG